MTEFPEFMRNPLNAISTTSQSKGIEGFVFDGATEARWHFGSAMKMAIQQGMYTTLTNTSLSYRDSIP